MNDLVCIMPGPLPIAWKKKLDKAGGIWAIFFLLLCGGASLIVTISLVLIIYKEYHLSKDFVETWCSVTEKKEHGQIECRHCETEGKMNKCQESAFPCIQLNASYHVGHLDRQEGTIHESAVQAGKYPACSYSMCKKHEYDNDRDVNDFIDKWYQKSEFTCYYNPNNYEEILPEMQYTRAQAVHAVFWPTFITVLIIAVFVFHVCVRQTTSHTNIWSYCSSRCSQEKDNDEVTQPLNQDHLPASSAPESPFFASAPPLPNAPSPGTLLMMELQPESSRSAPPPSYDEHTSYAMPPVQVRLQPPTPEVTPAGSPSAPPPNYC